MEKGKGRRKCKIGYGLTGNNKVGIRLNSDLYKGKIKSQRTVTKKRESKHINRTEVDRHNKKRGKRIFLCNVGGGL